MHDLGYSHCVYIYSALKVFSQTVIGGNSLLSHCDYFNYEPASIEKYQKPFVSV